MLIDARTLPHDTAVDADLCVIGAGPAGLTIARELADTGRRIVLLESGGDGSDKAASASAQELSEGEVTGPHHHDALTKVRYRGLGGSAVSWDYALANGTEVGVRLRPLDEIDFRARPWLPGSGWPFDRKYLDPFYSRAEDAMGIGRFRRDVASMPNGSAPAAFPLALGVLVASEFRFAKVAQFLNSHVDLVRASSGVHAYLYAHVTQLESTGDRRIGRVIVESVPGRRFTVAARHYVLAAGGIENPRLMLLSTGTHAAGIGNKHDLVGRYFMEHPHVYGGFLRLRDRSLTSRLLAYDLHLDESGVSRAFKVALSPGTLETERLLSSWTYLAPRVDRRYRDAVASVRRVYRARRPGVRDIMAIARGLPHIPPAVINRLRYGRVATVRDPLPSWTRVRAHLVVEGFELLHAVEQAPSAGNRVSLGAGRDRFGQPLTHLRFAWSDRDIDSVRRTNALIASQLASAGVGDVQIESGRDVPEMDVPSAAHHQIGTTRMDVDPARGVVDENCRVHGVENLYVAGSSVFPTGGSANPTLTIVALAIRLADRLRDVGRDG